MMVLRETKEIICSNKRENYQQFSSLLSDGIAASASAEKRALAQLLGSEQSLEEPIHSAYHLQDVYCVFIHVSPPAIRQL